MSDQNNQSPRQRSGTLEGPGPQGDPKATLPPGGAAAPVAIAAPTAPTLKSPPEGEYVPKHFLPGVGGGPDHPVQIPGFTALPTQAVLDELERAKREQEERERPAREAREAAEKANKLAAERRARRLRYAGWGLLGLLLISLWCIAFILLTSKSH